MLYTNLNHIETAAGYTLATSQNENVMIVCGSMCPASVLVYRIVEELEAANPKVHFFDMEWDNPESYVIKELPVLQHFTDIPLAIYYKNGKAVEATSGYQNHNEIQSVLNKVLTML
jgi:thioredoxin 1